MKILAVDDDGISLELLNECLSGGGYEQVTLMSCPASAMKALHQSVIAYDCILLDIEMPSQTGIELCAEIRRLPRYRNTPILIITKRQDRAAIERAFAHGATDYITKPFEFFEVLTRIRIAERLVQERQAAIDSYMAVQNVAAWTPSKTTSNTNRKPAITVAPSASPVRDDDFLSLSVFQNYLEQAVRADGARIDLIAIKLRNIEQLFATTTAGEFLLFLRTAAAAIKAIFGAREPFLAHAGKGMFLCAISGADDLDPAAAEAAIMTRLGQDMPAELSYAGKETRPVVGPALSLTTTPKLNFKRAAKAATARAENRETDLNALDSLTG